jgi:hypothetical protein
MSGARDGPHELAARAGRGDGARARAKGVKKRAMGHRQLLKIGWRTG